MPSRDQDANIENLYNTVTSAAATLIERDKKVQDAVTLERDMPDLTPALHDAKELLTKAVDEVHDVSEGIMQEELPQDLVIALDTEKPMEERKEAWYKLASRLLRAYSACT